MLELYFAILLIASSWKTRNSQSLESHNQNPTYGSLSFNYYLRVATQCIDIGWWWFGIWSLWDSIIHVIPLPFVQLYCHYSISRTMLLVDLTIYTIPDIVHIRTLIMMCGCSVWISTEFPDDNSSIQPSLVITILVLVYCLVNYWISTSVCTRITR